MRRYDICVWLAFVVPLLFVTLQWASDFDSAPLGIGDALAFGTLSFIGISSEIKLLILGALFIMAYSCWQAVVDSPGLLRVLREANLGETSRLFGFLFGIIPGTTFVVLFLPFVGIALILLAMEGAPEGLLNPIYVLYAFGMLLIGAFAPILLLLVLFQGAAGAIALICMTVSAFRLSSTGIVMLAMSPMLLVILSVTEGKGVAALLLVFPPVMILCLPLVSRGRPVIMRVVALLALTITGAGGLPRIPPPYPWEHTYPLLMAAFAFFFPFYSPASLSMIESDAGLLRSLAFVFFQLDHSGYST